jgi:hypothetical protein
MHILLPVRSSQAGSEIDIATFHGRRKRLLCGSVCQGAGHQTKEEIGGWMMAEQIHWRIRRLSFRADFLDSDAGSEIGH